MPEKPAEPDRRPHPEQPIAEPKPTPKPGGPGRPKVPDVPVPPKDNVPPYGIVYGKEGANFDDVEESGPYPSQNEARTMIEHGKADQYGGWAIVAQWVKSDGKDIATGKGIIVEVGQTGTPEPADQPKPATSPRTFA